MLIIFGCRSEPKEDEKPQHSAAETEKELMVIMGFKTSEEDDFKINLNNIKIDDFQKKNIQIRETVTVSTGLESIVAKFGANNLSNDLVLHLGHTKEKEIHFNGIELSYGNSRVLVTNANFDKYFRTNKYVKYDSINHSFLTQKVNGKHAPAIISRKYLMDFLRKQK